MPETYPGGYYSDGQGRDTYIVKDGPRLNGTYQVSAYDKNKPRPKEPVPESLKFGPPPGYQGHIPHTGFYFGKTFGQGAVDSAVSRGRREPIDYTPKIDMTQLFKNSVYVRGENEFERSDAPVSCKVMHEPEPHTYKLSPRSLRARIIQRYQTTNMFEYGEDQENTKPILPPYLRHIAKYAGHVPRTHVHASYLNLIDSDVAPVVHCNPADYGSEAEYAEACLRDLFNRFHVQGDDSAFSAYMDQMVNHGLDGVDRSGEDLFNDACQARASVEPGSHSVSIDGVSYDSATGDLEFHLTYAGVVNGEATTLLEDTPCKYRFRAADGKFTDAW